MEEIKEKLLKLQDKEYQEFQKRLCPNIENIIGVRIPQLREFAKKLEEEMGREFLDNPTIVYYEEVMIYGFLIGCMKLELQERFCYLKKYVQMIDNWATCDCPCSSFKFVKKNRKEVWEFIQPYCDSNKEFEIRFGVIMMLDYFIEDEYIDQVLKKLATIYPEGYYAKMAIAWTLSATLIKYQDKTMKVLKTGKLEEFVYQKTIQKAIESYRITSEIKEELRNMKKKGEK